MGEYMYVLECSDKTLYTGYTNNLEKRVETHNKGTGAKYTKIRRPVKLIFSETFETKKEAMQAEYRFKQLSRQQKLKYIESRNVDEDAEELRDK